MRVLNAHRDRIRLENEIPNLESFRLAFRAIKVFCIHHGLYSARFGYLGGIHIAIMLTRIAVNMPASTTATNLIRCFFAEYAFFEWSTDTVTAVSTNSTNRRTAREPISILSPERPVINVAANATVMNVKAIVEEFKSTNERLVSSVSWDTICGDRDSLVQDFLGRYNTYVKVYVSHWGGNCVDARSLVGFIESRIVHVSSLRLLLVFKH